MHLSVAIIGLGNIGFKMDSDPARKIIWSHAKAYSKHDKTVLKAVSETNKNNYKLFSTLYPNIKCHETYSEMVQTLNFDIISVCTPTSSHLSLIKNIFNINPPKALFIEKPMGQNLIEALEIVKLCENANVILAVNYMRRWDNKYKFIKETIDKKELGHLQTIVAYGCTALLTSTSHLIDLIIHFGGGIDWIVGEIQTDYIRKVNNINDHGGVAFVKFLNGSFGFLKGTSKDFKHYMFEIDLLFSEGRITISDDGRKLDIYKFKKKNSNSGSGYLMNEKISDIKRIQDNERMIDAISDIIHCIDTDEIPKCNGKDAIEVHRMIKGIKLSNKNNNKKIFFSELNV